MQDLYKPCPCGSGQKFKFCCHKKIRDADPKALLRQASAFPVCGCSVIENWQQSGMASIIVVRKMPNLRYIFGVFVVDYYCLGLKNTFCDANVRWDVVQDLQRKVESQFCLIDFGYEDARSLIIGSINYANKLGFKPNEDWEYSRHIVEADRPYAENFQYGKDGKPFYIQGPDDDVQAVARQLQAIDHKVVIVSTGQF